MCEIHKRGRSQDREAFHSNSTVVDLSVCRARYSLSNYHWGGAVENESMTPNYKDMKNILTYFLNFFKHVCIIYQFSICLVGLNMSMRLRSLSTFVNLTFHGVPPRYLNQISPWAGEPTGRAPNRSDHGLCCTILLSTWGNEWQGWPFYWHHP